MEPFDKDDLSERELDEILPEWKAPAAPASLRSAIFPERKTAWWRRLRSASIRLPLPAAACLALAFLGIVLWQRAPRVVLKEVPVFRDREVVVTREVPAARSVPVPSPAPPKLLPVAELRPRIVRGADGN